MESISCTRSKQILSSSHTPPFVHRSTEVNSLLYSSSHRGDHLAGGLSQICFRVESLKTLRFFGLTHGRVCLAASAICLVTSCISSLIESMLLCIKLMNELTISDTAAWKEKVALESSALVQSIRVKVLRFSTQSVEISSLTEIGR